MIEPYRAKLLDTALYTFGAKGIPRFNLVLSGRAKKNWKTTDLLLASLWRFLVWKSPGGQDSYILANDMGQARDDLDLTKKLIRRNALLDAEVTIKTNEIERRDGKGSLRILPAKDIEGAHGITYNFVGFDEIHGYRNWDLLEALALDPHRPDSMQWITSYASLYNSEGAPLHDLIKQGRADDDPRMFFSWYSADYCTDPAHDKASATAEARANPSMASFGKAYLKQQKRRLPTHKFRRLHLNLPGAPSGAAYAADLIEDAVVPRRKRLRRQDGTDYVAFVDMSGGSSDDACLAVAHKTDDGKRILDCIRSQGQKAPFDPRMAVKRFAAVLKSYGLTRVTGDRYAGETFRADFKEHGITYVVSRLSKHELYESFEVSLNAGEVELLDHPKLTEQLQTLVWRGRKIDHQPGDHDDFANAAAGAIVYLEGGAVVDWNLYPMDHEGDEELPEHIRADPYWTHGEGAWGE
ncbi:MAG TPA: hypothetical protein VMR74_07300 [Gammaproteobacteria bacterium]|nr:hypothetical protein [Gammaproteobacteria bacterium]